MKRTGVGLALFAGFAVALAGNAPAAGTQAYRLSTTLKAPAASSSGSLIGSAKVAKRSTIAWTLRYKGLSSRVRFAEVHYRDRQGLTQVILLCTKNCRDGLRVTTTFRGPKAWSIFIKQALAGKARVVVKTRENPDGEIRGVLKTRRM